MIIEFNKLRQAGYEVDTYTDDDDDKITSVCIRGAHSRDMQEEVHKTLSAAFPEVDHDSLMTIAYDAIERAQGQDIIRICSR
jgi:hypothetical protein